MSVEDDGGNAFPVPGMVGLPNDAVVYPEFGMTLRDYFAAKAIPVVASYCSGADEIAKISYQIADCMLEARKS